MEDTEFKVRIIDFYKDVDKPIINNIYEDNFGKNVLEFTTLNQVPILKKEKSNWKVKEKNKIIKDLDTVQKRKIKVFKDSFNGFNELDIQQIKERNSKLLSEIETISELKKKLDNEDNYLKLQNLASLGSVKINTDNKKNRQKGGSVTKLHKLDSKNPGKNKKTIDIKIIDIKEDKKTNIKINNLISSSDSEDFIEIFSN